MNRALLIGVVVLLLALPVLAASGCLTPLTETVTVTSTPTTTPEPPSSQLPSVADVVARVSPSVVFIHTTWTETSFFFGRPQERSAAGSGVIITSDGFILTNNHVIEDAANSEDGEITVTLIDGTRFEGSLWGADPLSDLAVLKVEAIDLLTATLGDSTEMRPGDWVIAIGNALDLPGNLTVSLGIVSALDRSISVEGGGYLHDLLQTDAAINPGNSGGPLINLAGEVVGINTAIAGGAEGIGFAISSTGTAIPVSAQLIENRRVIWPWLGISARTLTPSLASERNFSVTEGVWIVGVYKDAPAAGVGLAENDIIIALNEEKTSSIEDLLRITRRHRVGDEIEVTFVRGTETSVVKLRLAEMPR